MMRALVIDDSRAMRMILSRILKEVGFEVLEAGHGQEALERLKGIRPPELMLVDWNMPVMDGLALIKAIRADRAYDTARIMMVTTESERSRVAEALGAGANDYMMKPFSRDAVLEKLTRMGLVR
jgi:two-component system, chemotaxis family, chemotaxis protein CheY